MSFEERIAGRCLFGLICNESRKEQADCLNEIRISYGRTVAKVVEDLLSV